MNPSILKELPTPGHGCDGAVVEASEVDFRIIYGYSDETGTHTRIIAFDHVVAYKYVNEGHLVGFVSESYESIIEIHDSSWAKNLNDPVMWPFEKRHFGVFLRDIGYYEVLAESVEEYETDDKKYRHRFE